MWAEPGFVDVEYGVFPGFVAGHSLLHKDFDDLVRSVHDQRRLSAAFADADDGFIKGRVALLTDEKCVGVEFLYFLAPISHGIENEFRDVA